MALLILFTKAKMFCLKWGVLEPSLHPKWWHCLCTLNNLRTCSVSLSHAMPWENKQSHLCVFSFQQKGLNVWSWFCCQAIMSQHSSSIFLDHGFISLHHPCCFRCPPNWIAHFCFFQSFAVCLSVVWSEAFALCFIPFVSRTNTAIHRWHLLIHFIFCHHQCQSSIFTPAFCLGGSFPSVGKQFWSRQWWNCAEELSVFLIDICRACMFITCLLLLLLSSSSSVLFIKAWWNALPNCQSVEIILTSWNIIWSCNWSVLFEWTFVSCTAFLSSLTWIAHIIMPESAMAFLGPSDRRPQLEHHQIHLNCKIRIACAEPSTHVV